MITFKRIALIVLISIITFFEVSCVNAKIGVVDPTKLFQDSEPGKAGMSHLKTIEEAMQVQIDLAQGILEKSPKNEELRVQFQNIFIDYQQTINTEQQKVVEVINSLIQKTLDVFREENGYAVLITKDSLLSYALKDDVTGNIIEILNQTSVIFEPVIFEQVTSDTINTLSIPAKKTDSIQKN